MTFENTDALRDLYHETISCFGSAEDAADPDLAERVYDRFRTLWSMHTLVKAFNDETAYLRWIYLVPDDADDGDLMYLAYDNDMFEEAVNLFRGLFHGYGMDLNSLYIGNETY